MCPHQHVVASCRGTCPTQAPRRALPRPLSDGTRRSSEPSSPGARRRACTHEVRLPTPVRSTGPRTEQVLVTTLGPSANPRRPLLKRAWFWTDFGCHTAGICPRSGPQKRPRRKGWGGGLFGARLGARSHGLARQIGPKPSLFSKGPSKAYILKALTKTCSVRGPVLLTDSDTPPFRPLSRCECTKIDTCPPARPPLRE